MRLRSSIAIPILGILLATAAGMLYAGYVINKEAFYEVFEERESNKAKNIQLAVESIISSETKRIYSFASVLGSDTDIAYGLYHFEGTRGDLKPLKTAMDHLYPNLDLPIFVMTDPRGKLLYRAGKEGTSERGAEGETLLRATKGWQGITADRFAGGWGIRAVVPVYGHQRKSPSGVLTIGTRLDDDFARRIARDTGSQIFFATGDGVVAGSLATGGSPPFDRRIAKASLDRKRSFFRVERGNFRSFTYVPLKVVDNDFCLVIETDISVVKELLAHNKTRLTEWGLVLIAGIALVGAALTVKIILPINKLRGKALQVVRQYSGSDPERLPRGNEIATLVHATNVMVEAMRGHIAERARAEEALRETSRTLRELIEASPLAIVVFDAGGKTLVWNPSAERIFGWSAREAQESPVPILAGDANEELRVLLGLILGGERFSSRNVKTRTRQGRELDLVMSGAPLHDEQGRIAAARAIMADVTEARQAEESLRRSEERFRQAQKMEAVGKLAGGIAHDFNNLLSVITGYCDLVLLRSDGRSQGRHEIEEIRKAGERAAALTQQLLAFSRRQVLDPRPLCLGDVAADAGKMLVRLIGEDVAFVTESPPDLWTVEADPNQVGQILMNLAVNARDAMPDGGKLTISAANLALDAPMAEGAMTIPPGDYVTLTVADSGTGMDEATLSQIFEPFFTTKEQGKGTGLGLATVYGIVKQSGGFFRVRSGPGKGTTFLLYFPRSSKQASRPTEADAAPKGGEPRGDGTILLVEDEPMVRELATDILKEYGFVILQAADADEAAAATERHAGKIDLLITDLVLPGRNGLEVARAFSAARPGIPILFMSGYPEEVVIHLCRGDASKSFLQKPIRPSILLSRVREILARGNAPAAAAR